MKEHSLTKGSIFRSLLTFAVPVFLALFLQAMYGAADLIIVGQFAGTGDQSGVASGSQLFNTCLLYTSLFSHGQGGILVVPGDHHHLYSGPPHLFHRLFHLGPQGVANGDEPQEGEPGQRFAPCFSGGIGQSQHTVGFLCQLLPCAADFFLRKGQGRAIGREILGAAWEDLLRRPFHQSEGLAAVPQGHRRKFPAAVKGGAPGGRGGGILPGLGEEKPKQGPVCLLYTSSRKKPIMANGISCFG